VSWRVLSALRITLLGRLFQFFYRGKAATAGQDKGGIEFIRYTVCKQEKHHTKYIVAKAQQTICFR
jgi:hypothetical protein